jgi:hypothetical protein
MQVGKISENAVAFGVDPAKRKTKTRVSRAEDYVSNYTVGGSPFSIVDRRPNLPDGGTATIYYDDHDRPVEAEVHNSQDELVSSAVRTYDHAGRVAGERLVVHNPAAYLPLVLQDYLSSNSPHIAIEPEVKKLMEERNYSVEFSYNEHGDPEVEVHKVIEGGKASYSEMRYSYLHYDPAGNWTEKTVASRFSEEGTFEPTITYRRTLEYY